MKGGERDRSVEELARTLGRTLFASLPDSFSERYAVVTRIRHAFNEALASALQDGLNEHLKSVPQDTLVEKQSLATTVNEQMRLLGLAVRCPNTGLPGTLVADFKDAANENISRFRLVVRDPHRGRFQSFSANTLWELTLMEDAPRQESLARGFRNRGKM